jgi:hypothetical protein
VGSFLVAKVLSCLIGSSGPICLRELTKCVFGHYSPDGAKRVFKVLKLLMKKGIVRRHYHGYYELVNFPLLSSEVLPIFWTATNIVCRDCQYPEGTILTFGEFLQERKSCDVKSFEEGFNIPVEWLSQYLKSIFGCELQVDKLFRKITYVQLYVPRDQNHPILEKFGRDPGSIVHVDFRHEGPSLICEDLDMVMGAILTALIFTEIATAISKTCHVDPEVSNELATAANLIGRALARIAKQVQEGYKS